MFRSALIRYNFRVLMFHNWWLLVIPLAVSQLSIFWTIITQRFSPPLPATTVEWVSPLLAAFLCAHLLSAEYRSGIGAVLASKPVDIGKVVLLRLSIAIALVWTLGGLSLVAFYYGMEPYPLLPPALALMASSLFLGLLALTFATLFRHPLAGFGIAALYWALDLPPGPPLNSFLSLKSLSSSFLVPGMAGSQPLTDSWWIAKLLLVAGAVALYVLHQRLLFTLGSPLTARRRRRTLVWIGGLVAFYIASGAASKVIFGYLNRGRLYPNDMAWFRQQFAPYEPVPVAALFGPNFPRLLGEIPNAWRVQQEGEADLLGDSLRHRQSLRRVLENAPDSLWAASAADGLARLQARGRTTPEERASYYRILVDRYPTSPYLPFALEQIGHIYSEASTENPELEPKARAAYEDLLAKTPGSPYISEAFHFLAESDRRHRDLTGAANRAQQWVEAAPIQEKFLAWLLMAEIRRDQGKKEEATQAAHKALAAVQEFQRALRAGSVALSEPRKVRAEKDVSFVQSRLKSF